MRTGPQGNSGGCDVLTGAVVAHQRHELRIVNLTYTHTKTHTHTHTRTKEVCFPAGMKV